MKKFLLKTALFFGIITCIDIAVGILLDYVYVNAKGGNTYRDNFICNGLQTDVLLCGSSRCVHHYNPKIINDSLGMSCYNSGQSGNGIILLYGRLQMIRKHMNPKLLIYDVTPSFDLLMGDDDHRFLTWLKPYYKREGIMDIFLSVDKTEQYKMRCQMYRYNSHFVEIITDFVHPIINADDNGYEPIPGTMDKSKIRKENKEKIECSFEYDPLKLYYLEKYVESAGKSLVFVVSPIWYGMDTRQLQPIKDLCEKRGIPFIDFSNDKKFVHNDKYFKDGSHMNALGADEFTRDLIKALRRDAIIE